MSTIENTPARREGCPKHSPGRKGQAVEQTKVEHTAHLSVGGAGSIREMLMQDKSVEGAEYCRGYVQEWLRGDVIPERSAQKIFHAADMIIKAGQSQAGAANA